MTDSNTETTFANKIKIISELLENHKDNRWLVNSKWFEVFELGIEMAHALHIGAVIDSASRYKKQMEQPFDELLRHFGQEDVGFESTEEFIRALALDL